MDNLAPDFQRLHIPYIESKIGTRHANHFAFTISSLIEGCIYFAVRICIKPTWLNDRDQFYFPTFPSVIAGLTRNPLQETGDSAFQRNDEKEFIEFQNDCLAFTLFHSQNRITIKDGVNHWIPFTETEVNANYKFESHFMTNFINGERKQNGYTNLFEQAKEESIKREFSAEAQEVFDAGKEIWKYYHANFANFGKVFNFAKVKDYNVNASLYDIKEYFKGRNEKGNINQTSQDKKFNILDKELTSKLNILAQKIEPKVYEYGFLKA
jgi:hypothetical protein